MPFWLRVVKAMSVRKRRSNRERIAHLSEISRNVLVLYLCPALYNKKKSAFPPLGLLTVAALLPAEWPKRLVDENIEALKDEAEHTLPAFIADLENGHPRG